MPTITKNQIRPRRKKFRFSNAELLALDTTGTVLLVAPVALNVALALQQIQVRSNIVVAYGAIDGSAILGVYDDFGANFAATFDNSITSVLDTLFGSAVGVNLVSSVCPGMSVDMASVFVGDAYGWTDPATLLAGGGIVLLFNNGGNDLTDGDPLNYLDVICDYELVNLEA